MVRRDSKKGYGDRQDNRVFYDEISCFRIFECKMCKTEEIVMGWLSDWFVYLRNSAKVAKYGTRKLLIAYMAIRSYI